MSTLFAFLHHVAAFTLVSALAVEFVLIRQDLTLAIACRLPIVDAVLGISAGFLRLTNFYPRRAIEILEKAIPSSACH
ncbi:MAG: DUF2214 family protein [Pseudolabrys sp.]